MSDTDFRIRIDECPRCGGRHAHLKGDPELTHDHPIVAKPFFRSGPSGFSFWATCPKTHEPIFITTQGGPQ